MVSFYPQKKNFRDSSPPDTNRLYCICISERKYSSENTVSRIPGKCRYGAAYVIYKDENIASKTCWVFWLLLFPIVGVVLYLLFHHQASAKSLTKHTLQLDERTRPLYKMQPDVLDEAAEKYPEYKKQFSYLQNTVGYPVYDRTITRVPKV